MKTQLFRNTTCDDVIVIEKLRFQVSPRLYPRKRSFRKFRLLRAFSRSCVSKKLLFQKITFLSNTCGKEAKTEKKVVFSNGNDYLWTGPSLVGKVVTTDGKTLKC